MIAALWVLAGLAAQEVDFDREIRPIFARACVSCHGPAKQKSAYRLDRKAAALGEGSIGRPIVPGRPAESPLLRYVDGSDPGILMPPKGERLAAAEIARLRAWIEQGAAWPDDAPESAVAVGTPWALKPIARIPADIDRRIYEGLANAGLDFSPEADRRTLIRRLSFDVVGLPPTPEEIAAFEADARPDAYERVVDRLLASPRYGERWARHWLDVVRFAESAGFERNQPRPNAWPYRDYVIQALNEDRPFDRFIREQIAGEQLGAPAATGFLVAGARDEVRSPDPDAIAQQRADELNDMIAGVGGAFLGLTLNCARCHDHKFDPVSQAEYTALAALFSGVEHGERPLPPPDAADRARRADALREQLAPVLERLTRDEPRARSGRSLLLDPVGARKPASPGDPGDERRLPQLGWGGTPDARYRPGLAGRFRVWGSREIRGDDALPVLLDGREIGRIGAAGPAPWSGFVDLGAHDLRAESELATPDGDVFWLAEEPASSAPILRTPVAPHFNAERIEPVEAKIVRFTVKATTQLEPCLDELEVFAGGRNVARGAEARASGTLPGHEIHRVEHINDGFYGNSRSWISDRRGGGWIELEFPKVERIDLILWSRDREAGTRYSDRLPTSYEIEASLDGRRWTRIASGGDRVPRGRVRGDVVRTLMPLTPARAAERAELARRRKALEDEIQKTASFTPVYAGRFQKPVAVRRLHRGEVTAPRETVPPGLPSRLGPARPLAPDASDAERRRALADWIADPAHPLTARVAVNRLWQHHFGEGLVATPSDFGANGAKPTHPELLDGLASELIASGSSLKAMHRKILTSRAWKQSSAPNPAALKIDAGSRLLWRFPPRRLEAEALRDAVLHVSGALDLTMGGPGFDLFEPDPSTNVKVYVPKSAFGPADFRRMIYQSKPRMELDDVFGAFDCPDAGQPAPKRTVSTTPLQAMNLLNSAFMIGQAERFAARLEREAPDVGARARRAFLLCFGREPLPAELEGATALAGRRGLPALTRALLNANEFVTVP